MSITDTYETHSKQIYLNRLLQECSTLTIGVPIGIPNGGRVVMSGYRSAAWARSTAAAAAGGGGAAAAAAAGHDFWAESHKDLCI